MGNNQQCQKFIATWAVFFFVVWVRLLLCCLRHCLRNAYAATVGAYAAHPFEGVPTQAQRPHKATPQCMFLPTPSHFCLLLEGWKRNFCLRDHSPIHIFAARAPRLQSAHRHLAATPMCSSRTSNQVPKRTLNIWWINRIWTGADVGWWSVRAPEPTRCLREVYAKPTPVPGASWQESGETFLLSKS